MKQNCALMLYERLYDTLNNHAYLGQIESTFEGENISWVAKKCSISVVAISTRFKH